MGKSLLHLAECKLSEQILEKAGIPLYGVQNHYSIIARDWEKNGLLDWCRENGIAFWAWAVLEEGMLTDPRIKKKFTIMNLILSRQKKKLYPLYRVMIAVAKRHNITVPQVAEAFCTNKGIISICGCRKPKQVRELAEAAEVKLTRNLLRKINRQNS